MTSAIDSSTPTSTSSSSSSSNGLGFTPNDFMTLLTTQLQNQDPLSPMDPTQFASQLTQFNSLEQLLAIRQDLDAQNQAAQIGTTGGTGTGSTGGNAPGTPAS